MRIYVMIDLWPFGRPVRLGVGVGGEGGGVQRVKKINIVIFSITRNVINVKICMVVQLIKLYSFIPLSVILIKCQGHSSDKQF